MVEERGKRVWEILMGEDKKGLINDMEKSFKKENMIGDERNLENMVEEVVGLVEEKGIGIDMKMDLRGKELKKRVWREIWEINDGEKVSYNEIEERISEKREVRDVEKEWEEKKIEVEVKWKSVVRKDGGI